MGVGSGYTQADVTQLAYILTGWSIGGRYGRSGDPGAFSFDERAHEPLAAIVRERTYMQEGVAQGEAALDDLAREPATADHIAFKFARHFVADDPPPALTQRLAATFRDTDGDLKAVAATLIESRGGLDARRAQKLRNPWELGVASYRAFGREPDDVRPLLNALNLLGQPLWQPAGPNGFPDVSDRLGLARGHEAEVRAGRSLSRADSRMCRGRPSSSTTCLGPRRARRRARRSCAPKASSRPMRCWCSRRNSRGDEDGPTASQPPRRCSAPTFATFASASIPQYASAAPARDPRLVVVILRGALDGLSAVAPIGDPDYAGLHGELALAFDGANPAQRLDGFFGLHPCHEDVRAALWREAGAGRPCGRDQLSRPLAFRRAGRARKRLDRAGVHRERLAQSRSRGAAGRSAGFAAARRWPSAMSRRSCMRGPAPILGWAPATLAPPTDDFAARVLNLYAHRDPALAKRAAAGARRRPDGERAGRWTR